MKKNEFKKVKNMRIIVGLSGASSIIYGIRMLEVLKEKKIETDLIMSDTASKIVEIETKLSCEDIYALATRVHDIRNFTATLSSGSYRNEGMIVIPCSMKTIAGIASGYSDNLLLRAADATLKERRPLVLVPRETPLSTIHLRNMLTLSQAGAVILPACPGFYHKPETIDDIVNHIVGKTLDIFDIGHDLYEKWTGLK